MTQNQQVDNLDNTDHHCDHQYERRFQGTHTLYGSAAVDTFAKAHVYVIGVGGVGSWAAEALARTAVGEITLVDLDVLSLPMSIVSCLHWIVLLVKVKLKRSPSVSVRLTQK